MASSARGRSQMRETSPERTKVWAEQQQQPKQQRQRVPVVYYISRNGQLDHPHFMEVPISSHGGLFLRDVISRLNLLRGKGMATLYSWSSKRSYNNGFVWQDLSEDDFIHPAHGQEYVLKGSELLLHSASVLIPGSQDTSTSTASSPSSDNKDGSFEMLPKACRDESDFNPGRDATRIKKPTPPSWKSLDLNEYKVYKNELTAEASVRAAADASTQTDERRRAQVAREEEERNHPCPEEEETTTDEVSPPPASTPSPETLETLIRGDRRLLPIPQEEEAAEVEYPSGRMRASAVLMHLISCGSISMKEHHDLPVPPPHYRRRPPHPPVAEVPSFPLIRMEDKEYFSGSLIETKKKASAAAGEIPALKRSSSYNADRGSKMEVAEEEIEGVRAKCIPRKPKSSAAARKEGCTHGSKRIEPTQTPQVCEEEGI